MKCNLCILILLGLAICVILCSCTIVPSEGGSLSVDLYETMEAIYGKPYSTYIDEFNGTKVLKEERYERMYFDLNYQKTYRFKKGTSIAEIALRLGTNNVEMVASALDIEMKALDVSELTIPKAYKIDFYHVLAIYERWTNNPDSAVENSNVPACSKIMMHYAINVQDTNHRGAIISEAKEIYNPDSPEDNSFL